MNTGKIIGIVGVILLATFLLVATRNYFSDNDNINGDVINDSVIKDNEQVVDLTIKDYNYYPQVLNLKYNVPAVIRVDTNKVRGCYQSIVIPDFGVRKLVSSKDNLIRFTPDKKGTFSFSCSMGMGFGKIVVS